MNTNQKVMDEVLEQIQVDVANGDLTALEEMLRHVPLEILQGFLPEAIADQNGQLFP